MQTYFCLSFKTRDEEEEEAIVNYLSMSGYPVQTTFLYNVEPNWKKFEVRKENLPQEYKKIINQRQPELLLSQVISK